MRQRSISESKMVEESTPIKSKGNNSTSNLENRDPSGHDNRVRPVSTKYHLNTVKNNFVEIFWFDGIYRKPAIFDKKKYKFI